MSKKDSDSELDRPRWGVPAIAEVVHLTVSQTYYALEKGFLPASKVGGKWVSTRRRLQAVYMNEQETA
jgi:hypothetical protein